MFLTVSCNLPVAASQCKTARLVAASRDLLYGWMLQPCSRQRRVAFAEAVSAKYTPAVYALMRAVFSPSSPSSTVSKAFSSRATVPVMNHRKPVAEGATGGGSCTSCEITIPLRATSRLPRFGRGKTHPFEDFPHKWDCKLRRKFAARFNQIWAKPSAGCRPCR